MNNIKFPSFNLELNISSIAFTIFGISIYKYALCIVLGTIIGLIILKINIKIIKFDFDEILERFIITIIIGLIGARIYFVLFKFEDYKRNLLQVFNFRDGGLAIYGGVIFGVLYLFLVYRKNKYKLLDILDLSAPSFAIAQSIGRWGNFFNCEAYGIETTSFLRMGINTLNGYSEVHPTFLYESIATLLIFIILEILVKKRKYKGQVVNTYCFLYSIIRIGIEGIRTDSLMIGTYKVSQILSIIIFIVSSFLLLNNKKEN